MSRARERRHMTLAQDVFSGACTTTTGMTETQQLLPGSPLGGFVLDQKLAVGGMAEVWSATPPTGGQVALKVLLPHLVADREFRAMFMDEVNIALRLRHENIVHVHDARFEDGCLFIVMDIVDGLDLRRVLTELARARQWMPTPVALAIGQGMSRGLAYAHLRRDDRGRPLDIVHRDISPHNVMVTSDGGIKLLDFGIARSRERHAQTRPGVVKGKLGYMAPEQIMGAEVDPRADVFSMGIVLWEMLAMRRLFWAPNDVETTDRVISAQVPDVTSINDTVPDEAAAFIHQMLSRAPRDRPPTMRAVEAGLTRALVRAYPPAAYNSARRAAWAQEIRGAAPGRPPTAVLASPPRDADGPTQPD